MDFESFKAERVDHVPPVRGREINPVEMAYVQSLFDQLMSDRTPIKLSNGTTDIEEVATAQQRLYQLSKRAGLTLRVQRRGTELYVTLK